MRSVRKLFVVLAAVAIPAVLAACGSDDGADVRSASASGSGASASGASGSASGSEASGSGSEAGACDTVGDPEGADTEVDVALDEWKIEPAEDSVDAGNIAFHATNDGEEPHELVVVKGDSAADLPTDDEGGLDEGALPEDALVGEIEKFPAGEECDGAFELAAGSYVLLCNITETHEGEPEAHFAEGMHTTFTVK